MTPYKLFQWVASSVFSIGLLYLFVKYGVMHEVEYWRDWIKERKDRNVNKKTT